MRIGEISDLQAGRENGTPQAPSERAAAGAAACRALRAELGVSRAAAEAIMRQLPIVQIEDLRKTYVRREDVPGISTSGRSRKAVPA